MTFKQFGLVFFCPVLPDLTWKDSPGLLKRLDCVRFKDTLIPLSRLQTNITILTQLIIPIAVKAALRVK